MCIGSNVTIAICVIDRDFNTVIPIILVENLIIYVYKDQSKFRFAESLYNPKKTGVKRGYILVVIFAGPDRSFVYNIFTFKGVQKKQGLTILLPLRALKH